MNIVVKKGEAKSGYYSNTSIALATDWVGTCKLYKAYPGTASISKDLVFNLAEQRLDWSWLSADFASLDSGLYYMVGAVSSATLGVSVDKTDYLTLLDAAAITDDPITTLTMTIGKFDGTPAGRATQELVNTDTGTTIVLGWKGVTVTVSHPVADEVSGVILGTETVSRETNAAGFVQFEVVKGQTVVVSCPSFGKTVTVDTTGLDTIDLSSHF